MTHIELVIVPVSPLETQLFSLFLKRLSNKNNLCSSLLNTNEISMKLLGPASDIHGQRTRNCRWLTTQDGGTSKS